MLSCYVLFICIHRQPLVSLRMSEHWSWCVHAVLSMYSMASWNRKRTIPNFMLSRLIGLCQEPDLSPPHVHMLPQRQEGSIHQWPMLSTHTKCFISKLVCVCVCSCQTTPALLLLSTAYPPPPFFKAESLWAECFFSAISFHQFAHEMDSQISLVIFNKKPWDVQQKSVPPWTHLASARGSMEVPFNCHRLLVTHGDGEDLKQFENDFEAFKKSNLGRLL